MILDNQELKLNNLISLRKKITQQDMEIEMQKLGQLINERGAQKSGPFITATFAIEQNNFGQVLDFETTFKCLAVVVGCVGIYTCWPS